MSLLALVEYRVAGSSRSMALNQAVRPQLHFISSLKRRRREASSPSSMLNMRSILSMQHVSVSMSMSCSSRSLIPVSKHSRFCDLLVRSGTIDCVVIDSVAALVPRAEIEGEMGDATVGLQARLMSQALRKLTGSLSKSNTTCIFINQLREKIGVMFGSPETTTGGRALKFYSSVRIDIRRIESMKKDGEFIGNRVRAKIVKNKVAPPFRQAEFDLMYGEGISKEGCVLDMGVEAGIVNKSGSWFNYGEERLGQGRDAAKRTLQENPDLRNEIENKVRQHFDLPTIDWGEAASEVAQQQAQGE